MRTHHPYKLHHATGKQLAAMLVSCMTLVAVGVAHAAVPSTLPARAHTAGSSGEAGSSRPAASTSCSQYGVNLSGGEFGSNLPGTYGVDYIYPGIDAQGFNNAWEMDYFHSKGLNLLRVPLQWERLQHDLYGPLSTFDLGLIDEIVSNAAAHGMSIVIGPHNFARRTISGVDYVIGSAQVPYAAFTDFWHKMAAHFAGHPGVYAYALDNEPHDTSGLWVTGGAQAGVDGVRQGDMQTPILVPGDGWSGAWTWLESGNDALKTLNDPGRNLLFEAHQYFDSDGSGNYAQTYDQQGAYPNLGRDRLQEFVDWLQANSVRGMVNEYNVPPDDPRWLTLLDNALSYLQQNSSAVVGGAAWSAGPWWPSDYKLSVEPSGTWPNVTDRPQMSVLIAHTGCASPPSPTPIPSVVAASPTPGGPPTPCSIEYADMQSGSTFYNYVRCLSCQGILSGYSCGAAGEPCPGSYFRPGANVTRGQAAKIISNAAGYTDQVPSTQQTFNDVPSSAPFWLYVERVYLHGAISGYVCGGAGEPCPGSYFRPGANLTRGQLAKIDTQVAGYTDTPAGQTFADVAPAAPFYVYIERAHIHNIIGGYTCGGAGEPCPGSYFRPSANVTRGQTAKIISGTFFPACQTP